MTEPTFITTTIEFNGKEIEIEHADSVAAADVIKASGSYAASKWMAKKSNQPIVGLWIYMHAPDCMEIEIEAADGSSTEIISQ